MVLEWRDRPKRADTLLAKRRVWMTVCGRFKVEESKIKYGTDDGYPTQYRAMQHMGWGWRIVSRHRKRRAAMAALEHLAK